MTVEDLLPFLSDSKRRHLNCCLSAATLISLGKFEQASRQARRCLGMDPTSGVAHSLMAWALMELGKLEEAERHARTAIGYSPNVPGCYSTLAVIVASSRGREEEAEELHKKAIAKAPAMGDYYTRYASFLVKSKRPEAALEKAAEALQLDPRAVEALKVQAVALMKLDRLDEAEELARKVLSIEPDHAPAHHLLGGFSLVRGDIESASTHFDEALRIDPADAATRRAMVPIRVNGIPFVNMHGQYLPVDPGLRILVLAVGLFLLWFFVLNTPDSHWSLPGAACGAALFFAPVGAVILDVFLRWVSVGLFVVLTRGVHFAMRIGWIK